jgi:hypothetical protein
MKNSFKSEFSLEAKKDCCINGLVIWFDVVLFKNIVLSTSPEAPTTHWRQSLLHLKKKHEVRVGDRINGTISVTPPKSNHRALKITVSILGHDGDQGSSQTFKLE